MSEFPTQTEIYLEAIREELRLIRKALDAVTRETSASSDGGRTFTKTGKALAVTERLK